MIPELLPRASSSLRALGHTWSLRLAVLAALGTALASSTTLSFGAAPVEEHQVLLSTSAGDIVLQLDAAHAPKTVDNFLSYVHAGHFNGTVFHRVIPGFMIQAGGYTAAMKEKPTRRPIALEAGNGLTNLRGTVAMARTANPNSATAQFFVNLADNAALDADHADDGMGYAVFGKVVSGMDVVDAIAQVSTGTRGDHDDVPLKAVVIQHASVVR